MSGRDDSGAVMTITRGVGGGAATQEQQAEGKVSHEEVFPTASQVVKSDETTRGRRGDSADGGAAVKGASSQTDLFTGAASLFVGFLCFPSSLPPL